MQPQIGALTTERPVSEKADRLHRAVQPLLKFFFESAWSEHFGRPDICDFTIGNPHDAPMTDLIAILKRWTPPQDKYWYAYKMNEEYARQAVAASLQSSHGLPYQPEDVFLTNGSIAALAVLFGAIVNPGDEVIFITPPWLLYEAMILDAGGLPVRVGMDKETFDLDVAGICSAITAKTRAVIINSPHNPTGKIYPENTLRELAKMLEEASILNGRTIYIISDEAYRRIIFDGRKYVSPSLFYRNTFLIYTYGKVLLAPGQRIGYAALHPDMASSDILREVIQTIQMVNGWCFPNALMQRALADLEGISVDIGHLQEKRNRLVESLRQQGYQACLPEGTFYVMVRSPWGNDEAFVDLLNSYNIFCIPGSLMDFPGFFRLSITASDEMLDRAIPKFAAALKQARSR
jgi:aspartate aminotransferase